MNLRPDKAKPVAACGTCRWSDPTVDPDDGPLLWCRRFPPQLVPDTQEGGFSVWFPPVEEHQWCGEYTPAEAPSPQADPRDGSAFSTRTWDR